jgi:hypothetical protein
MTKKSAATFGVAVCLFFTAFTLFGRYFNQGSGGAIAQAPAAAVRSDDKTFPSVKPEALSGQDSAEDVSFRKSIQDRRPR